MIKYFCDTCGKEIPIVKKKNHLTGEYVDVLDIGKIECKEINLSGLNNRVYNSNVHTCKSCAEKISSEIDNELLNLKKISFVDKEC